MRNPRLPVTASDGTAMAARPQDGLSRYPTRTAPAVLGHAHTRLPSSAAATRPPWPTGEVSPVYGLDPVRGLGQPSTGSWQTESQGVVTAELAGGRG